MPLKLSIAQLNLVVGDLAGNSQKIIDAASSAYQQGARLVLTPELSICGYAAEDLFLRPAFIAACDDAVKALADALAHLKDLCVVVGHPTGGDSRTRSVAVPARYNAASVLREGQVIATYAKRELPNYQVFDERRYFTPGDQVCVFEAGEPGQTVKVGLLICEDAWFDLPARRTREAGAELLAVINASPFHVGKGYEREQMMRERVRDCGLPLVYAHLVGGQDEVVFEGHSFLLNADGSLAGRAPSFKENRLLAQVIRDKSAIVLQADIAASAALMRTCGTPWYWACVTTLARMASRRCCWGCRVALIRRWCWRLRWTHWVPAGYAP
jgi:NAD+ synthase (glutamine-hydrolysing)